MSPAEARKTVAAYLAGGRVSSEQLAEAEAALRSDASLSEQLSEALGISGEWVSECDRFLSQVGEFVELSSLEQERRMPEMVEHAGTCAACRYAYWDIKPLWATRAAGAARALAGQIRLVIDAAGRLVEEGIGPRAIEPFFVAATADAAPGPAAQRKEWELPDPETGGLIRLAIELVPPGTARLSCALGGEADASPAQVRIEVRERETGALVVGGRLADFETEPIRLPRGAWLVRLRLAAGGERTWEIPLTIE